MEETAKFCRKAKYRCSSKSREHSVTFPRNPQKEQKQVSLDRFLVKVTQKDRDPSEPMASSGSISDGNNPLPLLAQP